MVLELAQVAVLPGHEEAFEADLALAFDRVMSRAEGVIGWQQRGWCVERPNVYLFEIEWTTLEAHTEGFRGSELFTEWRSIIGPHFDGPPVVEHFRA